MLVEDINSIIEKKLRSLKLNKFVPVNRNEAFSAFYTLVRHYLSHVGLKVQKDKFIRLFFG